MNSTLFQEKSYYSMREHYDDLPNKEYDDSCEHPTIEQLFMREAYNHLTAKQKKIWEYHIFEKLTQDEIAQKLGITQQTVNAHIRACETRIKKWISENKAAYNLLKDNQ
jgi:RNA polymerase sigma factor (sigma-70 family)